MFFPEHLLSKSGPLARVWLAANLEKKLSKNQVLQDKIGDDIAVILKPEVTGGPLALRLSGQLLIGVVRIYSRKARYLLDDCTEALMKIKMVSSRLSAEFIHRADACRNRPSVPETLIFLETSPTSQTPPV